MLGSAANLLALVSLAIVLGWLPLPLGIWPGISLGIFASLAGVLELRRKPAEAVRKAMAWSGLLLGALSALLGIGVYVGLIVMAG